MVPGAKSYRSILQRLPQDFEDIAGKLRKLVQKEHSVVRQADLARLGRSRSAADQPGIRHGVVRRAEKPSRKQTGAARQ